MATTTTNAKLAQFLIDVQLAHQIVHGGKTAVVSTDGGLVRSFANIISQLDDQVSGAAESVVGQVITARDTAVSASANATLQSSAATLSATGAAQSESAASVSEQAASQSAGTSLTKASEAAASATAALGSATSAATSAAAAAQSAIVSLNSAATSATSTTSLAIGTGVKAFVLGQAGKAFGVGQWVYLVDTALPSKRWMHGTISSFNAATGDMSVLVVRTAGAGSYAAWLVMPAAPSNELLAADDDGNFTISGRVGVGIAPMATVPLAVHTGANRNVGFSEVASVSTVSGLADAGASAALKLAGSTLMLSGDGTTTHVTLAPAGNLGVGVAPIAGVPFTVHTGANRNAAFFDQSGAATLAGLTDSGTGAALRVVGNTLTLSGTAAGGNHVFIDNAGNVGIGGDPVGLGGTGPILNLFSGTTQPALTLHNSIGGNTAGRGGMLRQNAAALELTNFEPTGIIVFATNALERARFDVNGNLGIGGVPSGNTKLEIIGAAPGAGAVGLRILDTVANATIQLLRTGATYSYAGVGANEAWLYNQGASNLTLGPDGAGAVKIVTNGAERARVDSAGNVGIGTLADNIFAKLEVRQDSGDGPILMITNRSVNGSTHKYGALVFSPYRDVASPIYGAAVWAEGVAGAGYTADLVFGTSSSIASSTFPGERLRITVGGQLYGTALHNNAGGMPGTTNQHIGSGSYTPAATLSTNVAAASPAKAQYMRVGNVVTVSGYVNITATAASTTCRVYMSLPIASNLIGFSDLAGSGGFRVPGMATSGTEVSADISADRATFMWEHGTNLGNNSLWYTYTYEVR